MGQRMEWAKGMWRVYRQSLKRASPLVARALLAMLLVWSPVAAGAVAMRWTSHSALLSGWSALLFLPFCVWGGLSDPLAMTQAAGISAWRLITMGAHLGVAVLGLNAMGIFFSPAGGGVLAGNAILGGVSVFVWGADLVFSYRKNKGAKTWRDSIALDWAREVKAAWSLSAEQRATVEKEAIALAAAAAGGALAPSEQKTRL